MTLDEAERESMLVNKLAEQSRKLGKSFYLLELVLNEEYIKPDNKIRIEKFLLGTKKELKLTNYSAKELSDRIIEIVFDYYNLPTVARYMKSRKREYVNARQTAMYFIRKEFKKEKLILDDIGTMFHKDHATVLHSIKMIQNGLDIKDKEITERIKTLTSLINKIYD